MSNPYRRKAWIYWLSRIGAGLAIVAGYVIGCMLWDGFYFVPFAVALLLIAFFWVKELVDEKAAELEAKDLYND